MIIPKIIDSSHTYFSQCSAATKRLWLRLRQLMRENTYLGLVYSFTGLVHYHHGGEHGRGTALEQSLSSHWPGLGSETSESILSDTLPPEGHTYTNKQYLITLIIIIIIIIIIITVLLPGD